MADTTENILSATVPVPAPCEAQRGDPLGASGAAVGRPDRHPVHVTVRRIPAPGAPPSDAAPCKCRADNSRGPGAPPTDRQIPPAPAFAPAPKLVRDDDSHHQSLLTTNQITVPLAKREYSARELCLFDLFGVDLQQFRVGQGGTWAAPVSLLAKAQAAVKAYQEGRGEDPSRTRRPVTVTGLRVPCAQDKADPDRAILYEALSLDTIDLVVRAPDCADSAPYDAGTMVVTAGLDHVDKVRACGSKATREAGWHTLPLSAVGLLAYYAGPPPPIIQTLASFCGIPYCFMMGHGTIYWIAALDGTAVLANATELGLLSTQ